MKKFIFPFFLLMLCSCGSNKDVINAIQDAKDDSADIFLITTDGKKIEGDNIKKTYNGIKMDGKMYHPKEVQAFQNKEGYFIVFGVEYMQRMVKGKIGAYLSTIKTMRMGESSSHTECYLKKGDAGFRSYTTEVLYDLIKDKPKAVEVFNENFKKISQYTPIDAGYKRLREVLDSYN